jgi:hypothetical protein
MIQRSFQYDFVDSRNLQGDDARVERNIQRGGLAGPSSLLPTRSRGGDGQVTVAEKRASVKGQMERGTLGSGGKKDRCRKGKACGATCIDAQEDCIIDFDVNVNTALNNNVRYLRKLRQEGVISEEQEKGLRKDLEDPKQFQKSSDRVEAYRKFGEMLKDGKITDDEKDFVARLLISTTLTPGQDRNAARVLSYDEINSILAPGKLEGLDKAYHASFVNGKFDPSAPGAMGEYIQKNILKHKISDEVAETAYYMLPSKVRSAIDRAGAVNQMFAGYDQNGNPIYSSTPTRERGVFLTKRWGEQGGLDPYTGKPIDIRNAEPEHMVAFKHAQAKGGGGGDQPSNLTWSAAQPNNNKAGAKDDFLNWKSNLEANKNMGREKYDETVYKPATANAEAVKGKKGSAPTDLEAAISAATPQQRTNAIKALLMTYGGDFRYLLRAANVGWQHQDRDLDHRKGGKPAFMDMDLPKLSAKIPVKPSTAVMIALAAVDPSKRTSLIQGIEDLRKNRIFTDPEAESVRGNNDARLSLKKQKSQEYGQKLEKLLEQYVPDLNVIL